MPWLCSNVVNFPVLRPIYISLFVDYQLLCFVCSQQLARWFHVSHCFSSSLSNFFIYFNDFYPPQQTRNAPRFSWLLPCSPEVGHMHHLMVVLFNEIFRALLGNIRSVSRSVVLGVVLTSLPFYTAKIKFHTIWKACSFPSTSRHCIAPQRRPIITLLRHAITLHANYGPVPPSKILNRLPVYIWTSEETRIIWISEALRALISRLV